MSRQLKVFSAALFTLLLSGGIILLNSNAAKAEPGSTADPLVSKSYVDSKFDQILALLDGSASGLSSSVNPATSPDEYNAIINEVMAQIETLYAGNPATQGPVAKYVPVSASAGQVIIGGEGTEIILRSGQAVGYCPGENGIVDATDGVEIFDNGAIKPNHILIVPRDDFRGVRVMEDAWFIIKGDYSFMGT